MVTPSGSWAPRPRSAAPGRRARRQHLDGTLWNQGNVPGNPPGFSKIEWNHIFRPNLFWNVKGAYYSTGFGLVPQGGLDGQFIVDIVRGEARGTADDRLFVRPQYTLNTEGSYFVAASAATTRCASAAAGARGDDDAARHLPRAEVSRSAYNPTSTRVRFFRDFFAKVR